MAVVYLNSDAVPIMHQCSCTAIDNKDYPLLVPLTTQDYNKKQLSKRKVFKNRARVKVGRLGVARIFPAGTASYYYSFLVCVSVVSSFIRANLPHTYQCCQTCYWAPLCPKHTINFCTLASSESIV